MHQGDTEHVHPDRSVEIRRRPLANRISHIYLRCEERVFPAPFTLVSLCNSTNGRALLPF